MNIDYVPINSNISNVDDTSFLLHNSRSKRSSLNSRVHYKESVQKIEKNKKFLKIFLIIIFYVLIFSLLYTTALFMKIINPKFYNNFSKYCHNKSEMATFLDLILSFFYIILVIYLISILEDVGTPNIINIKIFFLGLFFLFFGIKISLFIVYVKRPYCCYIDFFQFFFVKFFENTISVLISDFLEAFFIFYVYWKFRNFLILQQKEYKKILNHPPNGY